MISLELKEQILCEHFCRTLTTEHLFLLLRLFIPIQYAFLPNKGTCKGTVSRDGRLR
jgi:hypothetical protein